MDGRNICASKRLQSRDRLGLEQIGLWQLHAIDPKVPRGEQFAAVKSLLDDEIIRHAGLSNVTVADIESASELFRVATVQNRYNLIDRGSEDVLNYCEKHGIGFIPWFPLAAGRLAETGSILDGSRETTTPLRARLRWHGCSSAALSCCPFQARLKSRTWKRMSQPSTLNCRMKSSTFWTGQVGRKVSKLEHMPG